MEYILVSATLYYMAREVNARIKDGYEVVGGPHPGDGRSLQPHWIQAMVKKVEGVRAPAIGERGVDPKGAQDDQGSECPVLPTRGQTRTELNLSLVREDPGRIYDMTWGDVLLMVESSNALFSRRVAKLRTEQQKPYRDYIDPSDTKTALLLLQENDRVGGLVLEEIFASQRARKPNVVPMVQLSVTDAQLIGDLLTLNKGVQYPTEAQNAVDRFKKQLLTGGTP